MPSEHQKKLDDLVAVVMKEDGSDLHLSTGHHPIIRVNGTLIPLANIPEISDKDIMEYLAVMLSNDKRERFLANQEVDFSYAAGAGVRFRCNAYFQQGKIAIAMRHIPASI